MDAGSAHGKPMADAPPPFAPPGARLRAAIEADFGGEVTFEYGACVWGVCACVCGGDNAGRGRRIHDPDPPTSFLSVLPTPDGREDAAVCTAPESWYGAAPHSRVSIHLLPAGGAATLAALGAASAPPPPLTPRCRPPPAPRPPPTASITPLLAVVTAPASGRQWAVRLRARRTLGDALRFNPAAINAPLAACQLARALAAVEKAGVNVEDFNPTLDDCVLGGGGARVDVAPRGITPVSPRTAPPCLAAATAAWTRGTLPTLDYLLYLNRLAGRRWGDPVAHPHLPWCLDFTVQPDAAALAAPLPPNTSPPPGLRDLTKSAWRLARGDEQLRAAAAAGGVSAHHVPGDPLSEVGYCVSLARRLPKPLLTRAVRRAFQPGEYPASLERLVAWAADEAPPEAFCDPEFCDSVHTDLPDLAPPAWAPSGAAAVAAHAAALASPAAASRLPRWIDVTFGVALSGPAALAALNTAPPPPVGVVPGTGRAQLFGAPHPDREWPLPGESDAHTPLPPPGAAPGGVAALGRLVVQLVAGTALYLDPCDTAAWREAAAALPASPLASLARAALAPATALTPAAAAHHPSFDTDFLAVCAILDGLAAANAAAAGAGASRAAAAATGLARLCAADGALAAAPPRAAELALPALLDALAEAAGGGGGGGDTERAASGALAEGTLPPLAAAAAAAAAADAAAAGRALPLLLTRLPPGPAARRALAAVAGVLGGGPRGPPPAAATLLRPATVAAALRAGGAGAYSATLHAAVLDCLLAAPGGGGGGAAGAAAADALGEAASRVPLPAAIDWILRPLLVSLAAGPPVAAALVAVARALGVDAAARHVVPPLVAIVSAPAAPAATPPHRAPPGAPPAAAVAADAALTVLEALVPTLPPPSAARLVAPRVVRCDALARARLVDALTSPAAHSSRALSPRLRVRLAALLLHAAARVGGGANDDGVAAQLAPQVVPLFGAAPSERSAWGVADDAPCDDAAAAGDTGLMPPASPPRGLPARMAAALTGSVDGARSPSVTPAAPHNPPPLSPLCAPAPESGYWAVVHALYPDIAASVGPAVLRGAVPRWAAVEATLADAFGWIPPPVSPPSAADAAAAADLMAAASRLEAGGERAASEDGGGGASTSVRRVATDDDGAADEADAVRAARTVALIDGAGWASAVPRSSRATGSGATKAAAAAAGWPPTPARPLPRAAGGVTTTTPLATRGPSSDPPRLQRWRWLPPGVPPPPAAAPWSDAARWDSAPPPRAAAAVLDPAWRLAATPLASWRAHRERLTAVATPPGDAGGGALVTAGKGVDAGARVVSVWDVAACGDGGGPVYSGHAASKVVALAWVGAEAIASMDIAGGLHVWRPASLPTAVDGWRRTPPPRDGSTVVVVPRPTAGGFAALDAAPPVASSTLLTGGASGAALWVDADTGAAAVTVPLWAADAVSALASSTPHTSAAGSARGGAALADARARSPVAGWAAHPGARVVAAAWTRGGHTLMTAASGGSVRLWDTRRASSSASVAAAPPLLADVPPPPPALGGVAGVATVGEDTLLYGGGWVAAPPTAGALTLTPVRVAPPRAAVAGVALLPACRLLVVGSDDGKVTVCR